MDIHDSVYHSTRGKASGRGVNYLDQSKEGDIRNAESEVAHSSALTLKKDTLHRDRNSSREYVADQKRFAVRAGHLDQYRILQKHWQMHDAYCRVTMCIGTNLTIHCFLVFVLTYLYFFPMIAWLTIFMMLLLAQMLIKMDLSINRFWHWVFNFLLVGETLSVGLAAQFEYLARMKFNAKDPYFAEFNAKDPDREEKNDGLTDPIFADISSTDVFGQGANYKRYMYSTFFVMIWQLLYLLVMMYFSQPPLVLAKLWRRFFGKSSRKVTED